MATTVHPQPQGVIAPTPPRAAAATRQASGPWRWWALAGAASLALAIYVFAAWIISGQARTTPAGPDRPTEVMRVAGVVVQVLSPALLVWFLWRLIARPLWRRERIPFDGLLLVGLLSIVWQDPLSLYTQAWGTYNTAVLINFGSWATHIPGWNAPNVNHLGEPPLFLLAYASVVLLLAMLGCAFMRFVARRRPQLSKLALVAACALFMWVVDVVLEGTFALTGLYTFAGVPGPKLFAGHYYQFPLVEAPLMGSFFAAVASLRYFRDDRGGSVVERGLQTLGVGGGLRSLLRLLAVIGFLNVLYIACYNGPFQWLDLRESAWPQDVVSRSYFRSEICGPGTSYHCPGPGVPIPRMGSAHMAPDGRLVAGGHG